MACLSGTAFGAYGDGYLRFSIANSYEKLMAAVERIREFLTASTANADKCRSQNEKPDPEAPDRVLELLRAPDVRRRAAPDDG